MTPQQLREAGRQLAEGLAPWRDERPILLAIPRSGVLVGDVVARALGAPLDVLLARKVVAPTRSNRAIAAVAEAGAEVVDHAAATEMGVTDVELRHLLGAERVRLAAMLARIRGAWPLPHLAGRTVVLVDDGIVSGLTMRVAIEAVRSHGVRRIIVATPLCSHEAAVVIERVAHELVALDRRVLAEARRAHDRLEICPPVNDDEIHDLIVKQHQDLGTDPYAGLAIDGV